MKTIVWTTSNLPASPEERRARRPLGRNTDAFQAMLGGYERIAGWADELGLDAIGSAEHHFQTEAGETLANVLLFYAKLAAQTKRIMFTPLTLILPTHNPIRVAEDIALFSHMFPGRLAGVGFGRGYQSRWVQTLAQTDCIAAMHPASDARNREIFDEHLTIVERAWAEDSFCFSGKHFQVPYPAEGIPDWPLAEWTRTYGSPDEVDADGVIRKIGVVPKPLHRPTVFIPSVASPQTVTDAARNGRVLLSTVANEGARPLAERYRDTARESGRDLPLGQGIGLVRKLYFGDTFKEAFDLAVQGSGYWYHHLLGPFGVNEAVRNEDDDPTFPLDLGDARALTQRMYEKGQVLLGTEDQVREQVAELHAAAGGSFEWLVWEFGSQTLYGDDAADIQRQQLESFARSIAATFR
jgi:alkanesulfonate monooxygenase SsuD/methylene tetrahydromethanopterin reductase-like flavin-dependent oxidoreductase (luciferase family)